MSKTLLMTKGPPVRLMTRFAVPLMLANILQLCYTLVDSAVVGRLLGVQAFASVGVTASLYWLVLSAVIGMSIGFGTIFAQRFGAKDKEGLRRAFSTAVPLSLIIGAIIAFAGVFGGRDALSLMHTPFELLDGGTLYLGFLLGGMPVTFLNLLLGALLRALGNSKTPLRAMILSTLLNIVMDVALVYPFGIAGVAAATLLSQLAACIICARNLRGEGCFSFRIINIRSAKVLLKFALPFGFRNAVIEVGGLAVQVYINGYGEDFVAGIEAAKRMYNLLGIAGGALEASVGTFVAQNYGARLFNRIKTGVKTGLWLMLGSSAVFATAALLFGRGILSLLITGDPKQISSVLDVGQIQLNVMALGLPLLYLLFLYRSALQGIGNTAIPVASGFLELAGRVASLLVFTPLWGIWGVYLSDAAGWVLAVLLLIPAYLLLRKIHNRF